MTWHFVISAVLGRYYFRPTPIVAVLMAQAAADARLAGLMRNMADITSCQIHSYFYINLFWELEYEK